MRIILVGYMGAGKTTIGKKLARLVGFEFVDTDSVFCEKQGMSISDFIGKYGEWAFRKAEHEILKEVLKHDDTVVSTGGGTPCHSDNMQLIINAGIVIYIKVNPKVLHERVSYSPWKRPLLNGMESEDVYYFICQQLRERERFYYQATITLRGEGLKPQTIKEEIEKYLNI